MSRIIHFSVCTISAALAVVTIIFAPEAMAQVVTLPPPTTPGAPTVVDLGRDYGVLQPLMMTVLTAAATVATAAISFAAVWIKKKLNLSDAEAGLVGLQTDAAHRDALQTALTNAAGLALNKLGNELRGQTIDVGNPAVAQVINTVLKSAPDAVKYFGLENKPKEIAEKIVAKLPQVANTVATPT